MLNCDSSLMPNVAVRLERSALMEPCSTHGRVASAALTFSGQEAQVIPGTLRTTVATTGFGARTTAAGRFVSTQPMAMAATRAVVAPFIAIRMVAPSE
jgi:hypothetical protein